MVPPELARLCVLRRAPHDGDVWMWDPFQQRVVAEYLDCGVRPDGRHCLPCVCVERAIRSRSIRRGGGSG